MLNLPTFLFINGPSGSGKDTLAKLIADSHPSAYIEGFAEPIRTMLYGVFFPNEGPIEYSFDLREQEVKRRFMPFARDEGSIEDGDTFDANKNTWHSTIRAEMIAFSEQYMKRRYGLEIFGKLLLERCKEQMLFSQHFIISDSGFVPEAEFIISQVGADNCKLIRLHRAGCTYSGDSRGYITLPSIGSLDITNDGAPEDMLSSLQLVFGNL